MKPTPKPIRYDQYRPSSLPNLKACPRWVGSDSLESEAAIEGTLVHEALERLAMTPRSNWKEAIESDVTLDAGLKQVVIDCAEQIEEFWVFDPEVHPQGTTISNLNPAKPAIYLETRIDSGVVRPGSADLIHFHQATATLIDYKTNRVVRDHDAQQKAYVLGIFAAAPHIETVLAKIVAPRLGEDAPDPDWYFRADTPQIEAELREIVEQAADPFTPGAPGPQCTFCAGSGRCPYQMTNVVDLIPTSNTPPELLPLAQGTRTWSDILHPVTSADRGLRRELIRWLDAMIDAIKEDDKAWAEAEPTGEMDGFRKQVRLGRASLDRTRLAEANLALCKAIGMTPEQMFQFLQPITAELVEHVAIAKTTSSAQARKIVDEAMSPFIVRGAPIVSFVKVKPKKEELLNE